MNIKKLVTDHAVAIVISLVLVAGWFIWQNHQKKTAIAAATDINDLRKNLGIDKAETQNKTQEV